MLSLFYHVLLGIQFEHDNLVFAPCIPQSYAGSHWFTGLKIRNMVLDVHVNGYGSEICSVMINGKPGAPIIPLDTEGRVMIELELMPMGEAAPVAPCPAAREDLPTPQWDVCDTRHISWHPVPGATQYRVYVNGKAQKLTTKRSFAIASAPRTYCRRFHVRALNPRTQSSLSAPYELTAPGARCLLQPVRIGDAQAEYTVEHAQAWLDTRPCTSRLIYEPTQPLPAGTYSVRILYCNATASLRDGDTCALRELSADGAPAGLIALPHNTEQDRWEDYTYTAPIKLKLDKGAHTFALSYTPACTNGNRNLNQCMVRHLELTRLS